MPGSRAALLDPDLLARVNVDDEQRAGTARGVFVPFPEVGVLVRAFIRALPWLGSGHER